MTTERIREGLRATIRDARRDPYVIIDGVFLALALLLVFALISGAGVRP